MNEKEILTNAIENLINIANKNKDTTNDYLSIISLINLWKKQYKQYAKSFDKYLSLFKEKGVLDLYEQKKQENIAYYMFENYAKYRNPKLAEQLMGFRPGNEELTQYLWSKCSSRYMFFTICIGICGKPQDSISRYLHAEIYSWNFTSFYEQKIYYIKLYLRNKLYFGAYKHLAMSKNIYRKRKFHKENMKRYLEKALKTKEKEIKKTNK